MNLKRFFMLGVLCFLLFIRQLNPASAAPQQNTAYDIINGVNTVRASYGLPALEVNPTLMAAAQAHSDYQAALGQATHTGEGGTTPGDRARAAGYGGGAAVSVTENIFSGAGATALIAINWWVGDALHLQTLLGPYKHIGAGMAVKNGVTYFTLMVGYLTGDPGPSLGSSPGPGTAAPSSGDTPPVAIATPREDGSIIHIVGFGQTLWTIAALYNVPLEELLALNQLTEASIIYPGDELIIQLPTTGPTFTPSGPTYTPEPTTPTITPSPTTRPTRTPNPTRTLVPTQDAVSAQVNPTGTPFDPESDDLASQSAPTFRSMAPFLIVVLLVFAGGLVWAGSVLDRRKEKGDG